MSSGAHVVTEYDSTHILPDILVDTLGVGEGPVIRAITVTTLDGRASIDGVSAPLGNDADAALLAALRDWADVIVVGAGTVRAEDYGGHHPSPAVRAARAAAGRAGVPPVAVITGSAHIDQTSRLISNAETPPIFVTAPGDDAHTDRIGALREAGADVVTLPDTEPRTVAGALAERGLRRIGLEGGPSVYRSWLDAGLIDELVVTLAPVIAGSGTPTFPEGQASWWRLHAAGVNGSHMFLRYRRDDMERR